MSAAAGVHDLLDGLDRWVERAGRLFPALARDERRIREQAALLRTRGLRLEAPLVVLIAGGTGAGKSTLLNALAGEEIARASAVRPTTTALTAYVHQANELLVPAEIGQAKKVLHDRAALLDKVVVDTPDFDGAVRENEAVLRRALAHADLVIALATPEKYADRALYELLVEHREGRAFVFALNRADRGIEPEVLDDFRRVLESAGFEGPRLLAVSALAAFRRKRGEGGEPLLEGDFAALEAIIERELTRARIRDMKRRNLDALLVRLLERAAEPLPADLPERCRRWRRAGERVADEARAAVAAQLAADVRDDDALRHEVAARLATRFDGLFGFYQALVWGARALRGEGLVGLARRTLLDASLSSRGGAPPGPEPHLAGGQRGALAPGPGPAPEAETVVAGAAANEDDERRAGAAIALASRRMADLAAEQGLAPPDLSVDAALGTRMVAAARRDADRAIAAALRALATPGGARARTARLPAGFSAAAEARPAALAVAQSGAGRRVASFLLNAGPLGLLLYALYRWFEAFTRGDVAALGGAWFMAAGIVMLLLLALEGALVDWIARLRAARLVRQLEEAAAAAADVRVARPLVRRLEEAIGEVEGAAAALDALRGEAGASRLSDDAAPAAPRGDP
jgi:energy-coupling factor transporter ATP-binding protein EcfA2